MKININSIKTTPKNMKFNFCVYGNPSEEIINWINYWGLKTEEVKGYLNILVGDNNIEEMFEIPFKF